MIPPLIFDSWSRGDKIEFAALVLAVFIAVVGVLRWGFKYAQRRLEHWITAQETNLDNIITTRTQSILHDLVEQATEHQVNTAITQRYRELEALEASVTNAQAAIGITANQVDSLGALSQRIDLLQQTISELQASVEAITRTQDVRAEAETMRSARFDADWREQAAIACGEEQSQDSDLTPALKALGGELVDQYMYVIWKVAVTRPIGINAPGGEDPDSYLLEQFALREGLEGDNKQAAKQSLDQAIATECVAAIVGKVCGLANSQEPLQKEITSLCAGVAARYILDILLPGAA